jgi:RNA polymerase sigma-70 factor (ECF subfamily)
VDKLQFSDVELVQQLKNGQLFAGSTLYTRHKLAIYSFCLRMLADGEAAKDATQETFMKMISKIHSVDKGIALRSWLFSVARNEVLMVLRRKKIIPMDSFDESEQAYDQSTPYHSAVQEELTAHVQEAIQKLKPAYREVFLLREMEGLSYDEIANATGTTLSAVKSKIFKSRAALSEMLAPYMKENSL